MGALLLEVLMSVMTVVTVVAVVVANDVIVDHRCRVVIAEQFEISSA